MMPDFNVGDLVEITTPMSWYGSDWAYIRDGVHKIESITRVKLNNGYYYYYGIVLETIYGGSRLKYFLSEDLCFVDRTIMPLNIEEII